MNKQAILFAIGGMLFASVLAYAVIKPQSAEESVLSQTDTQTSSDEQSIEQHDTIDQLDQAKQRDEDMQNSSAPAMQIDQAKSYSAVLHTSAGDITIQFNDDTTPVTVNNFVSLARDGFYDGTIFHRVIDGFMIQGGDPRGDGTGGPGYKFDDEPFEGEYSRGTVAMANSGPDTNGSQFFIMHADYPLQKDYVIFGQVSSGMDVVDSIATAETVQGSDGGMSKPVSPVTVTSVDVIEE